MSKIAQYLQEHLVGEVMIGTDARRYFSTDNSTFSVAPAVVVYPRNENDVRKAARFTWQLAERGRVIPMTARGNGSDQSGAALGSGIMMVFPAHLNRILELDGKTGALTVEAGINFGKLQQTLKTHGRFLPSYPASYEYSTIGGAVGNNAAGEKSFKYGDMRTYVSGLRVVLANGEVITTGRINKRDLSKKLGLSTFEGEIYRQLDALIDDSQELIGKTLLSVARNNAGYDLADVKRPDGSFDLTPLLVGSQGTLGIATEIMLDSEPYSAESTLYMISLNSLADMQAVVNELRSSDTPPSALEFVDKHLLTQVAAANQSILSDTLQAPFPAAVLFVEFDNTGDRHVKRAQKHLEKLCTKLGATMAKATDAESQEKLWKIRQASSWILSQVSNHRKAVPVINDGVVPPENLQKLIEGVYGLFDKERLPLAVWGSAGDGEIHLAPLLNLGQVGDRQTAFRLMEAYTKLLLSLGGSTSGYGNDGRLRAPFLEFVYEPEVYPLFKKVKQIFDPYGTLNPGVKVGVTLDDIKPLMRADFSLEHVYDHLPRS